MCVNACVFRFSCLVMCLNVVPAKARAPEEARAVVVAKAKRTVAKAKQAEAKVAAQRAIRSQPRSKNGTVFGNRS